MTRKFYSKVDTDLTPHGDIATFPADEEEMHDLYSDKCKCNPETELWGISTIFMHNSFDDIYERRKEVDKTKQELMINGTVCPGSQSVLASEPSSIDIPKIYFPKALAHTMPVTIAVTNEEGIRNVASDADRKLINALAEERKWTKSVFNVLGPAA